MRENEFEKQVQKLMDELRLSPSASVWDKVRDRIGQRRRRWPLIVLLLVFMLGTAYLIYYQFAGDHAEIVNTKENNAAQKTPGTLHQDQSSKQDNTMVQEPEHTTKNTITGTGKPNDMVTSLKKPVKDIFVSESLYQKGIKDVMDSMSTQIRPASNDEKNDVAKDLVQLDQTNLTDSSLIKNLNSDPVFPAKNKPDTTWLPATAEATVQQASPVTEKGNNPVTKKRTRKVNIGITAFVGKSNTVENLFGINNSKNTTSGNFVNDPLGSMTGHPNKPFAPSFAYKFGGFIQKDISSKNSISLGINYLYFSTKAEVIYANPSLILAVPGLTGIEYINSYYRPAAQWQNTQQVNKYDFIGFDAAFHQSLISSKKTPLYADAGLSALRLLSANSLIYDNNTNTYYYKNDWLNKMQASFNLALSLHIKMNTNNYLFIGPEMNYGFTNLLKNKNYTSQHLLSYGLKAGWAIGRK